MGLREIITEKPVIAIGFVVVVVGIIVLSRFSGGTEQGDNINQTYFYDLQAGEIITMPTGTRPPATTDGGNTAVKAHVYSCGECNPDQWFFYIETLTEEAKQALDNVGDADPTAALRADQMGRRVAPAPTSAGDEPQWILASSRQGQDLTDQVAGKGNCQGKLPNICRP